MSSRPELNEPDAVCICILVLFLSVELYKDIFLAGRICEGHMSPRWLLSSPDETLNHSAPFSSAHLPSGSFPFFQASLHFWFPRKTLTLELSLLTCLQPCLGPGGSLNQPRGPPPRFCPPGSQPPLAVLHCVSLRLFMVTALRSGHSPSPLCPHLAIKGHPPPNLCHLPAEGLGGLTHTMYLG